ncbi:MAG: putative Ig domain-containing protein, partial [Anaerolineales bacterium]|nr:putative Ig domain-containing protein [Anaerolineales bacterium]
INPEGTRIAGAQLNIEFNPSLFRVNSMTEGNLFNQNGANTFFNSGNIDNSNGTVINVFNAIIGNSNISTRGTFIIINATAIGITGTSWINLSNVKISNPGGQPVAFNLSNGSVRINNPPVIATIGNKTVNEGQSLNLTLSATDLDGDILTYSTTNLPSGASFNPTTRIFQWTPGYTQSGVYTNVRFSVTDGILTTNENITIIVNDVNRQPTVTITPLNGSSFNETDSIEIIVSANDPDNFSLAYMIKIDGVLVSTTYNYTWITNYSSAGYHTLNISVSDGTITVNNTITIYINNAHPRYDVDDNGLVDIRDLVIVGQQFNKITSSPYPRCDVNMDAVVDIEDITIVAQNFGATT